MPDVVPKYVLTRNGMKEPAKGMCEECPLSRTSQRGYLGGYNSVRYVELLHGQASIACHMSKGFPKGLDGITEQRHCTGVAAYRANYIKDHGPANINAMGSAREAIFLVGPRDDVFRNPTEFHVHHNPTRKR